MRLLYPRRQGHAAGDLARALRPGGRVGITDVWLHPDLDPDLGGLAGRVACLADARPIDELQAIVTRAGLIVTRVERHDQALLDTIDRVTTRLRALRLVDLLGYEPHATEGRRSGNSRNGRYPKTVTTEVGKVELRVPRDRNSSFAPVTVRKGQRRLDGLTSNVISLYAKGMTTGDIQAHLAEIYGTEISRDTISRITDAIVEDLLSWQNRPLDRRVYPVLLIDAIVVKIRDGQVANRPIYVAMGINLEGERDVLGLWVGPAGGEGAKFWLSLLVRHEALWNRAVVKGHRLRPVAAGRLKLRAA